MKKIKSSQVNPKDRVVCVTIANVHEFYFQPYKSNERLHLFDKKRSPSISSFFKDCGVCLNGSDYSLTLMQLYKHRKMYCNHKIEEIFDRIPMMIQYVLRERDEMLNEQLMPYKVAKKADSVNCKDCEYAA